MSNFAKTFAVATTLAAFATPALAASPSDTNPQTIVSQTIGNLIIQNANAQGQIASLKAALANAEARAKACAPKVPKAAPLHAPKMAPTKSPHAP